MGTAELVVSAAKEFYNEINKDTHGRYRSWEYCYYTFYKARTAQTVDVDYLSLQLAFYLASWGMYRGSSFLLQKDYKIHIPVVEEVLKPRYDILFGLKCEDLLDEKVQALLMELVQALSEYYDSVRTSVKGPGIKNSISETLVTKTLMGTMGCAPAYDRYFIAGIKNRKVATGNFNVKSLLQLAQFYQENVDVLEKARHDLALNDIFYPQMKLIDMGFWQIGADLEVK
ncbi:hypothetical protein [Butyricicoccus porcorum]|uniref:hypothetical protein n=1 Tax=Butyricicoccus porcorum TaxID=1945634 RepID=UPI003F4ACB27